MADLMKQKQIKFLLVQIDEAHSTRWPIGLTETPEPQKTFNERIERCNTFVNKHQNQLNDPFSVLIDGFDNQFANMFRAWPDKYYLVNNVFQVIAKSEYGSKSDALIDVDCIDCIKCIKCFNAAQ